MPEQITIVMPSSANVGINPTGINACIKNDKNNVMRKVFNTYYSYHFDKGEANKKGSN